MTFSSTGNLDARPSTGTERCSTLRQNDNVDIFLQTNEPANVQKQFSYLIWELTPTSDFIASLTVGKTLPRCSPWWWRATLADCCGSLRQKGCGIPDERPRKYNSRALHWALKVFHHSSSRRTLRSYSSHGIRRHWLGYSSQRLPTNIKFCWRKYTPRFVPRHSELAG